jgi:hypothetical protein
MLVPRYKLSLWHTLIKSDLLGFLGINVFVCGLLDCVIKRFASFHYQKIDKYKRKYRGNISISKFPRDFTDGNIPSVYTVGKKIKTKQKKNDDVSFLPTDLPTELPTEKIPSVIPSVNLLVNCEHCSSC